MDLALTIAKSGLEAQHENIEVISNNLANISTTAFKRSIASFTDLPYEVIQQPGAPTTQDTNSPNGLVIGTGTKMVGNAKVYSDGVPIKTDQALDVQIKGRGFLEVQLPNSGGMAYTRTGSLALNSQGQITDQNGNVVQPAITVPQGTSQVTISTDGIVTGIAPGASLPTQLGQMQLADFMNPDGLEPIGNNLYLSSQSSGTAVLGTPAQNGYGQLNQGFLEGSNVNVVEEMVNLIEAQRGFEVTSKAVSAVDNMMQDLSRQG
jgi:flagellar basal-body rod protein FlgG